MVVVVGGAHWPVASHTPPAQGVAAAWKSVAAAERSGRRVPGGRAGGWPRAAGERGRSRTQHGHHGREPEPQFHVVLRAPRGTATRATGARRYLRQLRRRSLGCGRRRRERP